MWRPALLAAWVAALVCVAPAVDAWAQDRFEVQQLRPNPRQRGQAMASPGGRVARHGEWEFGALLNFADKPLTLESRRDAVLLGRVVGQQVAMHLLGSVGIIDHFELAFDWTLYLGQSGDALVGFGNAGAPDAGAGVGDLRIYPIVRVFERLRPAGQWSHELAFIGEIVAPIGREQDFQGERVRGGGHLAYTLTLPGEQRLHAAFGYLARPYARLFNLELDDTLRWSLALTIPAQQDFDVNIEVFGSASVRASDVGREELPTEVLLSGRYLADERFYITAGAGIGLVQGFGTPDFRGLIGLGYGARPSARTAAERRERAAARDVDVDVDMDMDMDVDPDDVPPADVPPADADDAGPDDAGATTGRSASQGGSAQPAPLSPDEIDSDGDGIPDYLDLCPFVPEDFDGIQDDDGCPELDADFDGILDEDDLCPLEPEDYDGIDDHDGCPE